MKNYFAKFSVALLALAVISIRVSAQAGGADTALTKQVDAIFAQWDKPDSPGCALGVIKEGRFIYQRGYGMANLDYNLPISPQSVFYLASVSKQFTAMSVLLLARQGKLSLDDPIRKYVPELPELNQAITIRHLIHHTSGIRDFLTLLSLAGKRVEEVSTNDEALEFIARQRELNFKPGEQYLYSNSGYLLLALIVQRASGQSLRQFADEQIFKPLGMRNTRFRDERGMIVKNRVTGYVPRLLSGFNTEVSHFELYGDGNLLSSLEDLALWDQNFYANKLGGGGQELIEQALVTGMLNDGKKLDYAFGLTATAYRGLPIVDHGGAFVGFRTDILRFPEQKFSVICLCNVENANAPSLARKVADVYLANVFKQEPATSAPVVNSTEPTKSKPSALTATELAEYVGDYYSEELQATYKIINEGDRLVAKQKHGPRLPLSATTKDQFTVGPTLIQFLRDDQQHISGLSVKAGRVTNIRFVKTKNQ